MAVPQGVNAQYYQTGRGLGLYQGAQPLATDPPIGTPAWWQNEGIKDAVNGWPSKTGVETPPPPGTPQTGQASPGQTYPPPNPGVVRLPQWADDYWSGYLWALQDPGTAAVRVVQTTTWSADYRKGLADGLNKAAPNDPRGLVPSAAQLALLPSGITLGSGAGAGSPQIRVRPAPAYIPKPGTTGGVYVPPPPIPVVGGTVQATFEIYGTRHGRPVQMRDALSFDGRLYHLKSGFQVMVGIRSSDGFGLGGRPGSWPVLYPSISPANYGLDGDKGVVEFEGRRGRAVPASDLAEIFGPTWRQQVYGTAGALPAGASPYEGQLLKSDLHPQVFLVENGSKRWIVNTTVFQNHGYSTASIQVVSQRILDEMPDGPPLST